MSTAEDDRPVPGADAAPVPPAPSVDLSRLPADLAEHLAALQRAAAVIAGYEHRGLDGGQAAVVAGVVAGVRSRLGAAHAVLLAWIEADGLWATDGARSFTSWVARRHGLPWRAAAGQVKLGRALRDHLPRTAAAALAGDLTHDAAQVLATHTPTTETRRTALADPDFPCNEDFLVDQGRVLSVDGLRLVARRWAALADPDADDRGYIQASDREYLEVSQTTGGYHLAGFLTLAHGQALTTALRAITPVPAAGDERTTTQRRAHALGDLAHLVLDHTLTGATRTARPHLNVIVDYQTLQSLTHRTTGYGAPPTTVDAPPTMRDGPTSTGAASRPTLTPAMITGDGPVVGAQFEDGTPIPRALLDRIACDSDLARIIFGPDSHVLDVGRAERTFTGPRRTALIARDKHCRYPTCTAPPALCEGHHIQHWTRDHGETTVTNGILLCWHHHDLIHRRGIDIHRDGTRFVFTDRHGRELRNGDVDAIPP